MLINSDGTPRKRDIKYNVGDKVLVKSSKWYFENRNDDISKWVVFADGSIFGLAKSKFCDQTVTIEAVTADGQYIIAEDDTKMHWSKECFVCKIEPVKTTLSARDRGRIDEIIKALKFLEEDKMLCYADEIDFLKKIREW